MSRARIGWSDRAGWASAALLLAALMAVVAVNFVMSIQDYRVVLGLTNSPFVWTQNFEVLFSGTAFPRALKNSAVLKAAQLATGMLLGLPLALGIALSRKPRTAFALASLCLIPMCLPFVVTFRFAIDYLPADIKLNAEYAPMMFAITAALQTAGFAGFAGGVFAGLKLKGVGKGCMQGVAIALLIQLLTALTPEFEGVHSIQGGLNRQYMETLDTYQQNIGFMNMQYSLSAAVYISKAALQALIALPCAFILARMAPYAPDAALPADRRPRLFAGLFAFVIWLIAITAACFLPMGADVLAKSYGDIAAVAAQLLKSYPIAGSLRVSAVSCLICGAFALFISAGVMCSIGRPGRRGFVPIAIVLSAVSTVTIGAFIIARSSGLVNTLSAPALSGVLSARFIAVLLLGLAVSRICEIKRVFVMSLALAFIAAACHWGEYAPNMIYVSDASKYSISYLLRSLALGVSNTAGQVNEADWLRAQTTLPAVMLMTALPTVLLSLLAGACVTSALKD